MNIEIQIEKNVAYLDLEKSIFIDFGKTSSVKHYWETNRYELIDVLLEKMGRLW